MSLTKLVRATLDSRAVDVSMFDDVEVWEKSISNEVAPQKSAPCFQGAWYRKVVSSTDHWLGIEGVIKLGEFTPDLKRFDLDGKKRFMDNPSIYMGGKALLESDAGLGLNVSYDSNDFSEELSVSSPKLAYRPFWRYIYKKAVDIKGNVERSEVNSWNITESQALMYYYFPGDVIRMKIYSPVKDYLQLRIEVVEPTKIEKYVNLRKKYNLKNGAPSDFYSPIFHSEGHGYHVAEFKRVNSIDQYGNEGFVAKDTDATVSRATWLESFLYRKIDGKIVKVPFHSERQLSLICPNEQAISVDIDNPQMGGESITIHPGNVRK